MTPDLPELGTPVTVEPNKYSNVGFKFQKQATLGINKYDGGKKNLIGVRRDSSDGSNSSSSHQSAFQSCSSSKSAVKTQKPIDLKVDQIGQNPSPDASILLRSLTTGIK